MNPFDLLMSRLEGVRSTGKGKCVARCPSHSDKHPSLSLKELDDGTVLLHCFAGCDAAEVISAVGLEFSDLFPPRRPDGRKPERGPFNAADLIHLAAWESLIASIVASDIAHGRTSDRARLVTAASRLAHIAEVAHVR